MRAAATLLLLSAKAAQALRLQDCSGAACYRQYDQLFLAAEASRPSPEEPAAAAADAELELLEFHEKPAKSKPMEPHMYEDERALFYSYLGNATNYLEYGSGGSTVVAMAHQNIRRVHTVESDKNWIKVLSKDSNVARGLKAGLLQLVHANLGPVGSWGYPLTQLKRRDWPKYSGFYAEVGDENTAYDLVLVDGRFRVACMLKSLRRLAEGASAFFIIHDYERTSYHAIERFAEKVASAHRLQVFRKKENVDPVALAAAIANFEYTLD